jgi:hypothetical protein
VFGDAGADAQIDAPSAGDANATDSSSNNDAGPMSGKPYFGGVTLNDIDEVGSLETFTFALAAGFYELPDGGQPPTSGGCAGTMAGKCCRCASYPSCTTSSGDGGTVNLADVSAGTITIKDGASTLATMVPSGAYPWTTYAPASNPPTTSITWSGGDTVVVAGAGDLLHAFSGSIATARRFSALSPPMSPAPSITRSSDFTMTWTPAGGTISIWLMAYDTSTSTVDAFISCTAPDTGSMTIPGSLLGGFAATDIGTMGIGRTIDADASIDDATITLASIATTEGGATFK